MLRPKFERGRRSARKCGWQGRYTHHHHHHIIIYIHASSECCVVLCCVVLNWVDKTDTTRNAAAHNANPQSQCYFFFVGSLSLSPTSYTCFFYSLLSLWLYISVYLLFQVLNCSISCQLSSVYSNTIVISFQF